MIPANELGTPGNAFLCSWMGELNYNKWIDMLCKSNQIDTKTFVTWLLALADHAVEENSRDSTVLPHDQANIPQESNSNDSRNSKIPEEQEIWANTHLKVEIEDEEENEVEEVRDEVDFSLLDNCIKIDEERDRQVEEEEEVAITDTGRRGQENFQNQSLLCSNNARPGRPHATLAPPDITEDVDDSPARKLYRISGHDPVLRCDTFACNKCDYTTSQSGNMRRHVLTRHTDYRPYICSFCQRQFNRTDSLKNHLQRVHVSRPSGSAMDLVVNDAPPQAAVVKLPEHYQRIEQPKVMQQHMTHSISEENNHANQSLNLSNSQTLNNLRELAKSAAGFGASFGAHHGQQTK